MSNSEFNCPTPFEISKVGMEPFQIELIEGELPPDPAAWIPAAQVPGQVTQEKPRRFGRILLGILKAVASLVSAAVITAALGLFLLWGVLNVGIPVQTGQTSARNLAIMDRFIMYITNVTSAALDGVLSIDKVYWLNDDDTVAPEPDPEKFGTCTDPAQMQDFLDQAAELLDGQKTLFTTETELLPYTEINYYLDETIMVITWKQVCHGATYTISEVKIAHPSQFRRFLADGTFGSDKQYTTTHMAQTVNAVTASSGDFYKFRALGISVYNGEVMRMNNSIDTCFITDTGDMLFSRAGELATREEAQKFVEENGVRFSLAFGPVLVDNHQIATPRYYTLGEPFDRYARAVLAKMDDLHYLLIAVNQERGFNNVPNVHTLADQMMAFGVEKAYCLDGGQTAVIVTNDKLINRPTYGFQRLISDIIYFATAVPDGG